MSRKGDCLDNPCSETQFASLKVARLHGQRFQTIRQAKDETLDWLLWYNRALLRSTLKYISPMQFEQQWKDKTQAISGRPYFSTASTTTNNLPLMGYAF
jgi:transposase InsO family protein